MNEHRPELVITDKSHFVLLVKQGDSNTWHGEVIRFPLRNQKNSSWGSNCGQTEAISQKELRMKLNEIMQEVDKSITKPDA